MSPTIVAIVVAATLSDDGGRLMQRYPFPPLPPPPQEHLHCQPIDRHRLDCLRPDGSRLTCDRQGDGADVVCVDGGS